MLRIIFDKNAGQPVVMADGTIPEICNKLSAAVGGIYQFMKQYYPDAAKAFKVCFQLGVALDKGLVWNRSSDSSAGLLFCRRWQGRWMYPRKCPECGAYLDPDERCDCHEPPEVYRDISE